MISRKLFLFLTLSLVIVLCVPFFIKDKAIFQNIKLSLRPVSYFKYSDLVSLSKQANPQGQLKRKLQRQLTTPYVVNGRWNLSFINTESSKKQVRFAHWNISRGYHIDAIKEVFSGSPLYFSKYKKNVDSQENLKNELDAISNSEVICLNEVDIGMPRTKYKNIAHELASAIGYNYVFATEFVELGPIVHNTMFDPGKYQGLHGNVILSKYPIKNARIIRLPQFYKWYEAEINRKSPLEHARVFGAMTVFDQSILLSEVRHGSRCALVADIELPNKAIVTVVSVHLEDRCYPRDRFKQIEHLFEKIKHIRNPVVIAGDLNTSTTDSAPTSFKKEVVKRLKDRDFIARQLAFAAIPGLPVAGSLAAVALSKLIQYKDPAAPNIPVFLPNHERKLFKYIKDFKFQDGESFDTSGDSKRSSNGKRGLFANSNERQFKGFVSTFKFEEPRVIAYFKLDWFFVKPKRGRFKPFNGQTLKLINHSFPHRISDHEPIIVDIAL